MHFCERLYVQSGIYERFLQAFVERTTALRLGASLDYEADVGLMGKDQLLKVDTHVRDAVAQGATVLAGGCARPNIGPFFLRTNYPDWGNTSDASCPVRNLRSGSSGILL